MEGGGYSRIKETKKVNSIILKENTTVCAEDKITLIIRMNVPNERDDWDLRSLFRRSWQAIKVTRIQIVNNLSKGGR